MQRLLNAKEFLAYYSVIETFCVVSLNCICIIQCIYDCGEVHRTDQECFVSCFCVYITINDLNSANTDM